MNTRLISKIALAGLTILFCLGLGATHIQAASPSATAIDWRQVNQSGFGDPLNNQISTLDVFNDQLYAGTWNLNGAQVWRADENLNWTQFTPAFSAGTSAIIDAEPFNGRLYIGTAPQADTGVGEMWRTDGNTWQQITANGFGDSNNYDFSAFALFSNQLYVATGNIVTGIEIWRSPSGNPGTWTQVNSDGFDGTPSWPDATMQVYNNYLYVGFSRVADSVAELWRSADGETWTPVFTDGLGDANNTHLAAMETFKDTLYISLRNITTGGQVWRSTNGKDWTPVFQNGLGDPANSRPYGLIEFENHLYLVFNYSVGRGAEVWRSADGSTWRPVMTGGWGDVNNTYADYFDKAAVEFKDSLFIGTGNDVDGGEIWQKLHPVYLPVISRGGGTCGPAPTLIAPLNGSTLNTINPLYQWDSGNNPLADTLRLQVAYDPGFTQGAASLWWSGQQGYGDFRFSRNLNPGTTYYWRTFLLCGDVQGPYSQVWSFKTGSNGVILPAPTLVSPPDGSTTPNTTVTLNWSPVNGSIEYLTHLRIVGDTGYFYNWTTETQEVWWLDPGIEYEWWVSARNDYAIGADSQTWHFTTPAILSVPGLKPQVPGGIVVIDGNGNEYIYPSQGK